MLTRNILSLVIVFDVQSVPTQGVKQLCHIAEVVCHTQRTTNKL